MMPDAALAATERQFFRLDRRKQPDRAVLHAPVHAPGALRADAEGASLRREILRDLRPDQGAGPGRAHHHRRQRHPAGPGERAVLGGRSSRSSTGPTTTSRPRCARASPPTRCCSSATTRSATTSASSAGALSAPRGGPQASAGGGRQHAFRRAALALQRCHARAVRGRGPAHAGGERNRGRAPATSADGFRIVFFQGHPSTTRSAC